LVHAETSSGEKPIYKPINPCRLADTRPAPDTVGTRTSPLGPEEPYTLMGWGTVGNCTLPNGTAGLALNVTAVDPSQPTYLTLYPTGASLPTTSNLNPWPGQPPTPNAVNVDLNGSGQFDVYNKYGNVHVIVDVVGYYDDHNHDDIYYRQGDVDTKLATKANAADVYTKTETDNALATKANAADVYTKTETDNALATKANAADVYTKTETDNALATKANAADVYTKTEIDATSANVLWVYGTVYSSGTKGVAGQQYGDWTPSKTNTGIYTITIPNTPVCDLVDGIPQIYLTPLNNTALRIIYWSGISCSTGSNTTIQVAVKDSVGTYVDDAFQFLVYLKGYPVASSPASAGLNNAGDAPTCTVWPDQEPICTNGAIE
jgi:hypothetical protein